MSEPPSVIAGPNGRPALSLSEAARATGVSRSTIRRRREAGEFPTAFKDRDGVWRVPYEDLSRTLLSTPPTAVLSAPLKTPLTTDADRAHAEQRVADLEQQLRAAEQRARLAEALADERERALADVRLALRALTAATAPAATTEAPATTAQESAPTAPRTDEHTAAVTYTHPAPAERPTEPPSRPPSWWQRLRKGR